MKFSTLVLSALVALGGTQTWAQTNKLSTVNIVTGVVTVTDRVGTPTNRPGTVGNNLAGLAYVAGNVPAAVDTSVSFFTLTGSTVPPVPADAFTSYGTLISPTGVGSYPDVAGLLTGSSYSGLTFAIDDLGLPIAGTFYTIHHRPTGDYFANIVPRTGGNSSTADLKPMSWAGGVAGGPSDPGLTGYFGLVYATGAVSGYSANSMFYLRTAGGNTQFGEMIPALTAGSTDKINLSTAVGSFGVGGYTTLAYSPVAFGGYASNQFYYLRLDSVTGNTVLGRLDPSLVPGVRTISDIANLGGVFNTLNYAFDATGPAGVWGINQLYATGGRTATSQSVSFAAIADRAISAGSFTVTPSASSGLAIALTVVPSSTGSASISGPAAGVFTVTPLSPGIITLQATQSGGAFDSNMLRQSFNATGVAALVITTQPTSQVAVTGTTASFSVVASGTSPVTYQWRKGGFNILGNLSATTSTLTLTNVQAVDAANYDVVVTNLAGSVPSNTVTLTVTSATPVITNAPLTAAGTVGTPFTFTITATNSPTSYSATPLPAGLVINTATGAITGTPTTVGTTNVLLGATNGGGTGNATLVVTVSAAGVAPVITSPLTAAGTVATAFSYTIVATNSPTSYSATPLPAGLVVNTVTGVISGTPTTVGTTNVLLGATNAFGTGNATLVITVAAAGVAPVITSPLTAAGTVGAAFSYSITATGSPTSYTATPLPAGLSIVALTGVITGTPTTVGTTNVLLGATNAFGTGNATLVITVAAAGTAPVITSALTAAGTVGTPFSYSITATNTPTSYTATPLPAGLSVVALTGVITGTPTTVGTTNVILGATNAFGTGNATLVITVAAAGTAPVITSALTAAGTVATPFSYAITATNTPTSYTAAPLPAGLSIVTATGVITGTPTTVGTTNVILGATNAFGTGNATLVITVAAAGVAPVINSPLTAAGTVGTGFGYTITATNIPTSYSASPLPAGLSIVTATGAITGTPTTAGTTNVLLGATNAFGTGSATLVITVAAAGVAPVINSPLTAAGTVGSAFGYSVTATGSPTSYSASPLPAGLSIVTATGAITGTPASVGTTNVLLGATNAFGTGSATLTITVGAAGAAPLITNNPLTAAGNVGTPFSFGITATGSPLDYSAAGLPPGLGLNILTGVISGTPTVSGTTTVSLIARNNSGTDSATLIVTIGGPGGSPFITNITPAVGGTIGTPFSFVTTATGSPTNYTATPLPPGLSIVAATGAITGTPTTAGTTVVTLGATNAAGTGNATLTITIAPAGSVPVITNTSLIAAATLGTPFSFPITATGTPTSYAATNLPPGLAINPLTGVISGTPTQAATTFVTITVTNGAGAVTGTLMIVTSTTVVAVPSSQIVNFAARAISGPGSESLIMGFVVAGEGTNLLVRGIGPGLAPYGVVNVLADPFLTLFNNAGAVATNDDWQTNTAGASNAALIAATAARVGAFPLPAGSKDAALLLAVNKGAHTTGLVRPNSTTGVALTEIYDIDRNPRTRLINVSARMNVTIGEGTLIAGLVIVGNAPKTLLIRGVGPTLAVFGVTGVLADPTITVFGASGQIATNDNWGTSSTTAAQFATANTQTGAFALQAGSRDAALLVTLQPGTYTVQVSGVAATTGVALVEVYDVP